MADAFVAPGQTAVRHELLMLIDAGYLSLPVQSWPISSAAINAELLNVDISLLSEAQASAYRHLKDASAELEQWQFSSSLFLATDPIVIRGFEDTPRADAGVGFNAKRRISRFSINFQANALIEPLDQDDFNLDGTYVAAEVGNWMLSAGWQERWWGPGWNSSLILSTNARPSPGISLQRKQSKAFESSWLSWIGPWTLTTFMNILDDERAVDDALLWGARIGFVPIEGLEIGLSRTAQWCGSGRSCSISTFSDVLLGNDNRGVNVSVDDEPGNQLAGVDLRWRVPGEFPAAFYMQWIGEDTRQGGPEIGSWLRQAGVEHWGDWQDSSYRLNVEWADTACREGGAGFSSAIPNCAYRHSIYTSGYNYEGRSIAHSAGGDSRTLSLGATLVQSGDKSWNISIRHMQINREGVPDSTHTISAIRRDLSDIGILYSRPTQWGRLQIGLRVEYWSSTLESERTDLHGFLKWSSL